MVLVQALQVRDACSRAGPGVNCRRFRPLIPGCVIPVSAADALAWADGRLNDSDLLLRAPLKPEAVFLVHLPELAAYRGILEQILYWRRHGAVFMICRTGNPIVDEHIVYKNGGRETYREVFKGLETKYRFIVPRSALTPGSKRPSPGADPSQRWLPAVLSSSGAARSRLPPCQDTRRSIKTRPRAFGSEVFPLNTRNTRKGSF